MSLFGDLTGGLLGESTAEKAAKDATKTSKSATGQAMEYVNGSWRYINDRLDPYAQAGAESFQNIRGMDSPDTPTLNTDFDFKWKDLRMDPGYNFRLSQGLKATDRIAAGNRNLGAGNRAIATQDYAQGLASTEYQNAWERALQRTQQNNAAKTNQYNLESNKYGQDFNREAYLSNTGIDANNRLSDYAYRTGVDKGNLTLGHAANTNAANMYEAQARQQFLSDQFNNAATLGANWLSGGFNKGGPTSGPGGSPQPAGAGTTAPSGGMDMNPLGTGATVGRWVGGKWVPGAGAEAAGATTTAGSQAAGWGATAAAAAPLFGFAAIVALDQFLDDGANVGKTREKLSQSNDPIGFILGMSNSDLSGLSRSSQPGISGINEKRGLFFSTMASNLDEQGLSALKADPRSADIVDDMLAYHASSMYVSPKAGGDFDDNGLKKLFPEIAGDLDRMKSLYRTINTAEYDAGQNSDSWRYSMDVKGAKQRVASAENEIARLTPKIYSHIYSQMGGWG